MKSALIGASAVAGFLILVAPLLYLAGATQAGTLALAVGMIVGYAIAFLAGFFVGMKEAAIAIRQGSSIAIDSMRVSEQFHAAQSRNFAELARSHAKLAASVGRGRGETVGPLFGPSGNVEIEGGWIPNLRE